MGFLGGLFGGGKGKRLKTKVHPAEIHTAERYYPEQQAVIKALSGGLLGPIKGGLGLLEGILSQDPEALQKFTAPAHREFSEKVLPTIAEQFSGLNAQDSSGFQSQVAHAGTALTENLAKYRGELGIKGLEALRGLIGGPASGALVGPYDRFFSPRSFETGGGGGGGGSKFGNALGTAMRIGAMFL